MITENSLHSKANVAGGLSDALSAYIEPTIYFNYNASNTTGETFIDIANVSSKDGSMYLMNDTVGLSEQVLNSSMRAFLLKHFPPDYIEFVPSHWLDQSQPHRGFQIYTAIMFLLISITGNVCQIMVLLAYARCNELYTASNQLLISLLVADFLLLLNCYLNVYQGLIGIPVLGVTGCKIYGVGASVACLAEVWSLAAVACDRFRAVYYPLERGKRLTKLQAKVIIIFIWTTAITFSIFPLFGWNNFVSESYFMGCAFDMFSTSWTARSYVLVLFMVCWFIPLIVIISSYCGIIMRVRSPTVRKLRANSSTRRISKTNLSVRSSRSSKVSFNSTLSDENLKASPRVAMEITLAKMVSLLIFVWLLAWTPYVILSTWIMFFNAKGLSPVLGVIPTVCCKISAGANALLYGLRLPKFKVEIKKMIVHILPPRVSSYLPCIDSSALASTWDRRESDVFMSSNHRASVIQESSNSNSEGIGLFEKSLIKLHDSNRSSLSAPIRNEIHTYEIPKRGSFEGMTSRGNIRKLNGKIRRASYEEYRLNKLGAKHRNSESVILLGKKRLRHKSSTSSGGSLPLYNGSNAKRDLNGITNCKKTKAIAFCEPERINAESEYLSTQSIVTTHRHFPISESVLPTQQTELTSDSLPEDLESVPFIDEESDKSAKQGERFHCDTNRISTEPKKECDSPRFVRLKIHTISMMNEQKLGCIKAVAKILSEHDRNYKSVNLGEEVIREMIMCSFRGSPVNSKTAMTAYRAMLKRVDLVATHFEHFKELTLKTQQILLKHNSDLIVSLQGANFFQVEKNGQDQILHSLGFEDHDAAMKLMEEMKQTYKINETEYKAISYKKFNTIQEKKDDTVDEQRYDELVSRVGASAGIDKCVLVLLSYALLFSSDFEDEFLTEEGMKGIERSQQQVISILERYIYTIYSKQEASKVFNGVLQCLADLRELCAIKQKRRLLQERKVTFSESANTLKPSETNITS